MQHCFEVASALDTDLQPGCSAFLADYCPGICGLCTLRDLYIGRRRAKGRDEKLLTLKDGTVMDYGLALGIVKELCIKIGRDPSQYGTHSLRKGGCQAAIDKGYPDEAINAQAGWAGNGSRGPYEERRETREQVDDKKMRALNREGYWF